MVECPECGKEVKTAAGLASHRRWRHPEERAEPAVGGANLAAANRTLAELDRMGRLVAVDDAAVTAVRSIAAALDANPFNSQMWREYREALKELTDDGDDDGGIEALLHELSDPKVRDTPTS